MRQEVWTCREGVGQHRSVTEERRQEGSIVGVDPPGKPTAGARRIQATTAQGEAYVASGRANAPRVAATE